MNPRGARRITASDYEAFIITGLQIVAMLVLVVCPDASEASAEALHPASARAKP